jgi:RinA family phage transcriptional activator
VATARKELRAYIEAELRGYHQTMIDLEAMRDDVINESPAPPDGMPRGTKTSDPTFTHAMKLINCQRLNQMYRVTYAIGNVVWSLPPDKQKLVQLTYWTKPQTLTAVGIAMKLNCHPNTFYLWRNEICKAIARELGML